jgi:hypothetical protein
MDEGLRLEPLGPKLTAEEDMFRTEARPLVEKGGCRLPPSLRLRLRSRLGRRPEMVLDDCGLKGRSF